MHLMMMFTRTTLLFYEDGIEYDAIFEDDSSSCCSSLSQATISTTCTKILLKFPHTVTREAKWCSVKINITELTNAKSCEREELFPEERTWFPVTLGDDLTVLDKAAFSAASVWFGFSPSEAKEGDSPVWNPPTWKVIHQNHAHKKIWTNILNPLMAICFKYIHSRVFSKLW